MRSNRNDWAFDSSASPRESWNEECRWQSTKPGVATVARPSMRRLAGIARRDVGRLADRDDLAAVDRDRRVADDAAAGSMVISQAMSAMMRSTDCTGGSMHCRHFRVPRVIAAKPGIRLLRTSLTLERIGFRARRVRGATGMTSVTCSPPHRSVRRRSSARSARCRRSNPRTAWSGGRCPWGSTACRPGA